MCLFVVNYVVEDCRFSTRGAVDLRERERETVAFNKQYAYSETHIRSLVVLCWRSFMHVETHTERVYAGK